MNDLTEDQVPQGAMALVESGGALVRAMNDQMAAVAVQRPRDARSLFDAARAELEAIPEIASDSYWVLPRGGRQLSGPSIHAAQALLRHWGNATVTSRFDEVSPDAVTIVGIYIDMQTNTRIEAPLRVSRWTKWNGRVQRLDEDNWNVRIANFTSKALRNVILRGLPRGLVDRYVSTAKQIVANIEHERGRLKSGRKAQVDAIRSAFAELGLADDQVLCYHSGCRTLDLITAEGIVALKGIYNACKEDKSELDRVVIQAKGPQQAEEVVVDAVVEEDSDERKR